MFILLFVIAVALIVLGVLLDDFAEYFVGIGSIVCIIALVGIFINIDYHVRFPNGYMDETSFCFKNKW